MNKVWTLLSGVAVAAMLGSTATAGEISFKGVAVPTSDADKRAVLASPEATVDGKTVKIGYHVLQRSGNKIGDSVFGQLMDKDGKPVMNKDGSKHVSVDADFSSLLPVGDKLYSVSHFESRPGAMYLSELKQDKATGKLTAVSTKNIDFSEFGGLWVPCAGSVTPWGTHLGSEEYPPSAFKVEKAKSMEDIDDYYKPMGRYFGLAADTKDLDAFRKVFKPYKYGYATEIAVDASGAAKVSKHFAMGRLAFELAYVMPDQKTVYMSDDGTNVGFYMFVADKAGDLSAGNLYAAKWHQKSAENGGKADLTWVALGHADEATIKAAIDKDPKFSDIFESAKADDAGKCPAGFTSTNKKPQCLKVKDGMEMVASRLETTIYAAYKGATTEFRKEEGITFDPDGKQLFVAMSQVARGMEDFAKKGKENKKYDRGGPNDVTLPYNYCGTVYALDVSADEKIGSEYVAKNMNALVSGKKVKYGDDSPYKGNKCDVDGIANPDNVTFIRGYRTLIIGEDTGSGHQNDVIWSFNMDTKKLTRIQTTPYGSETTSPYFYKDVNGWGYLMSVIQHPYGESDQDKLADAADAMAYVGYVGPFPAMK
jgi:secreted PhoX family phosphatase